MTLRSTRALLIFVLLGIPLPATAQRPDSLAESDLVVAGISYGMDSAEVRTALGNPIARDSSSWEYSGLRIFFDGPKVHQIALVGRRYATRRGLAIGDSVPRITRLYGQPCSQGSGGFVYCRSVGDDPEERGILIQVAAGLIHDIRVGLVIDLD